jgi:peptidoglycan hydrolase-like protein with peptidoglycan-binding domain
MTRKFALVAGMVLGSLTAGSLLAQNTATPKPNPSSSSMQQPAAKTQQDSAAVHATAKSKVRHAAWTKDQIKDAQEGLSKAGFYKGEATGVYDRKTRRAIRAYQKANKLPVTGRLNNDLLTRLHSA